MSPDDGVGVGAPRGRRIATIGLHSSASTWVFNVVRELLIASAGERQVMSVYADELHQLPPDHVLSSQHLLVKSHHGSSELDDRFTSCGFQIVLSIRDPRDAAVSMAQRFKTPLALTADWIKADCERMLRLVSSEHPVLKYEARFFDDITTMLRIADMLGLVVEQGTMREIFERYRTDAVGPSRMH